MSQIIKYLSLIVTLLLPTFLQAEDFGRHITIETIELEPSTTIPTGTTVNFLGVIDVSQNIAPSGRLATFAYEDRIFNADAALFYQPTVDSSFTTYPARSYDNGKSASICTTMASKLNGINLTFADEHFSRYFEITKSNQIVENYIITQPKDIFSRQDSQNELCIKGLAHSTSYQVKLLPGLQAKRLTYSVVLDQPISFQVKTPSMKPMIQVDGSKTILTNSENAVIPIEFVNVNEIEISLHKVDLASLTSYGSILEVLDGYDVQNLSNFWGDVLTKKSIPLDNKLNQKQQLNINFSDLIGPNERGLFVATFTSPDVDIRSYQNQPTQWFSISDMSVQIFSGLNKTDIFLRSFENTNSIDGASVQIIAANNRELFNGETTNSGRISVPNSLLAGSGGFKPAFIVATSESFGTSILQISELEQKPRFLNGGEIKTHEEDVYLTTDRETYRSGEMANVFGVIRQLNLEVITEQEFDLKLLDRNGGKVIETSLEIDSFGAFDANIQLGQNFQLGKYIVQIEGMDEEVLAQHSIMIDDFVPLTIEPTVETDNEVWQLNTNQNILLSGDYYSGGPAAGLKSKISTYVKTVNKLDNSDFEGFVFGDGGSSTVAALDEFEAVLDVDGQMSKTLFSDFDTKPSRLYEVLISGTVFDVGGRANTKQLNIPLDTATGYVGIRPNFDEYIDEGVTPSFTIANVTREGQPLSLEDVSYTIQRIYYDYNWNYNNGWRWNRVRVDSETVDSGLVSIKNLVIKAPLNWGRYEIIVTNNNGFKTVTDFYVGWGADVKPASEPEEIALTYINGILKGNAGYPGTISILVADEDIVSVESFQVEKGNFELPIPLPEVSEPGVHLLASLVRPIQKGSEHLPQISLGKTWVPTTSAERSMNLSISSVSNIDSSQPITVTLNSASNFGSAKIFIIDEGIHALTTYKNKDLRDHFLSERALNFGIITNFGQLISQDLTLSSIRVGGDGDMMSAAASVDKSEFFKTITLASPMLEINNGTAQFTFPATMEWEGKLRVVAFGVDKKGFGFSENYVTVQDPVSIDVSMPRFVTPTDTVSAKINVRWNDFTGPIELRTRIQDVEDTTTIAQTETNSYEIELPISVRELGQIPISIGITAGGREYIRNYSLVSRLGSYPVTELVSTKLEKKNWLGLGSVQVQPFNSSMVDLGASGSGFSISLTPFLGVNLNQVVSELNRYPYGCVEQVSSKTRGLIALSKVKGISKDTSKKIQAGIDRLLAKQKYSGAFGYWDRNSFVYEQYQPYAVDTLQKALPYAEDKENVIDAINRGLEYLYRASFDDQNTKLYAYGLLAKSGYEVTSRARYSIDQQLKIDSTSAATTVVTSSDSIDDLTLAYWVSAHLNDTKRMLQISDKAQFMLNQIELEKPVSQLEPGAWISPNQNSSFRGFHQISALQNAHLLTDLQDEKIAPVFETILANTHEYLAQRQYRSTIRSAKLVSLQQHQERSLAGTSITLDGANYELDATASLPISLDQLKTGFKLSHNATSSLYLNIKSTGQRRGVKAQNNGYQVEKWWFDRNGNYVDLSSGVLPANQGDLYTVVISITRKKSGYGSDLLVTDLLPAGFEIEKAVLGDPTFDGLTLDFERGKTADYTAAMDDRFIAHFKNRWYSDSFAYVRYTVRAAYETTAIIPDSVVEEMYSPEVNGRSKITESIVSSR